jgi:hypothetical protein
MTQILGQPQHQLANVADFRSDDEKACAGIPQNGGLSPQMILDLSPPERGVDGNRHASRIKDSEKRREKRSLCGQHDGHAIALPQPPRDQTCSYSATLPIEFGIRDRLFLVLALPQQYVRALAM